LEPKVWKLQSLIQDHFVRAEVWRLLDM
jgi:hypothetical protein